MLTPTTNPIPTPELPFDVPPTAPVSPTSKSRIFLIVAIVIIVILVAVFAAVWLRQAGVKTPALPPGDSVVKEEGMSEEQRSQLLQSLSANATSTQPTEAERAQLLKSLNESSTATKPLTPAEQERLLKSLQQ